MQTNPASRHQIVAARRLSEPVHCARSEVRARYRSRLHRWPYIVGIHSDLADYMCCATQSGARLPRLTRRPSIWWAAYCEPDTGMITRFLEAVSDDDMFIVPAPAFPHECEAMDRCSFRRLEDAWAAGRSGVIRDEFPLHPGRRGVAR
jgi:hypothetical protein